jgi:hypothetical protein
VGGRHVVETTHLQHQFSDTLCSLVVTDLPFGASTTGRNDAASSSLLLFSQSGDFGNDFHPALSRVLHITQSYYFGERVQYSATAFLQSDEEEGG